MTILENFIGRQEEIRKFENLLDNYSENTPHIAFIYSDTGDEKGGIGKTKLLYQFLEIAKSPKYEEGFLVIDEIIDFYEPVNRDRMSRLSRFAQMLEHKTGIKAFDNFWESTRGFYAKSVSAEKVIQEYFNAFSELCKKIGKNIICFFDTFEAAETTLNYYQKPYRFVEDMALTKSFVVISGRNKPDLNAPIWEERQSQIEIFPLKGFTNKEAEEFFVGAGHNELSYDHICEINKKAKGRPILLALVVDYLNTIIDIKEILELYEEKFKEELVDFINRFETPPIGQAILAMAHIKHRCNDKFLRQFVGPTNKFDKSYKLLKSLSFVRDVGSGYIVLHDEMQKMVSEFILDKVYAGTGFRREISQKAIEFYDSEIALLREQEAEFRERGDTAKVQVTRDERFITTAERWYHILYVTKAVDIVLYFHKLYDTNLEEAHLDFCFVLQNHLDDLCELLDLPDEVTNRIKLRKAKLYAEKYQFTSNPYYYDKAENLFNELIDYAETNNLKRFLGCLWYELAALMFYNRTLVEAQELLKKSVEILSEEEKLKKTHQDIHYFQGIANNWLGYVLYSQGKFRKSIKFLDVAEEHLNKAAEVIQLSKNINEEHKELRQKQIDKWIAQVRGNLCRIYREIGESDKSVFYGESSLHRRKKLGNLKEIIKGLNSLGLIYARRGDHNKALTHYLEAEAYLQNVPDPILQGRILTNKATLFIKRDLFSDLLSKNTRQTISQAVKTLGVNDKQVKEARDLLSGVIQNLIKTNSRELATAYHNLGELDLMIEKYEEALKNFEEAARVAKIGDDIYTLLNSLQRLVLTAYLINDPKLFALNSNRFSDLLSKQEESEETIRYVIRYHITKGNYFYDELFDKEEEKNFRKNFITAFKAFTDAIVDGYKHSEGSGKFATEVFSDRLREVLKYKGELSPFLSKELKEHWQKKMLDVKTLEFFLGF